MTDNNAIVASLTSLETAVVSLQSASVTSNVYDPFGSNDTFNLPSCLGSSDHDNVSSPLDNMWNRDVGVFPSFVVSLRIRKRKKTDANGDTNIVTVATKHILTVYHFITGVKMKLLM